MRNAGDVRMIRDCNHAGLVGSFLIEPIQSADISIAIFALQRQTSDQFLRLSFRG